MVLAGTTFLGIAAGIIGCFALLRNKSLMGDALAHSSLPGLAMAFILAASFDWPLRSLGILLSGAAVSGILGVFCVKFISERSRIHEEAAIGIVLSVFFGAGIVLLSIIQSMNTGREGGLKHFIYGQTAAMLSQDAWITLFVALIALVTALSLLKEFRVICFDEEFAAVQGWPVGFIDLLMMSLVVLVTVVGLQTVGMLLVVALLIIPPAAARFWTDDLSVMIPVSGFIGGLSGYLGSAVSTLLPRMPTGAVIVLTGGVLFFISFFLAPKRGVAASALRHLRLRIKIAEDHLLRELYEYLETKQFVSLKTLRKNITVSRAWPWWLSLLTHQALKDDGYLKIVKDEYLLTQAGLKQAALFTRNHRLWEQYLIAFGFGSSSHVDYMADMVEHVLSPQIVSELESALRLKGQFKDQVPPSIHPIL
ncbi:MAG: iron chelate uptake ABC transporter family permease subunit [Bdellovibrionota bacterium]